jgi:hypothetical protein
MRKPSSKSLQQKGDEEYLYWEGKMLQKSKQCMQKSDTQGCKTERRTETTHYRKTTTKPNMQMKKKKYGRKEDDHDWYQYRKLTESDDGQVKGN